MPDCGADSRKSSMPGSPRHAAFVCLGVVCWARHALRTSKNFQRSRTLRRRPARADASRAFHFRAAHLPRAPRGRTHAGPPILARLKQEKLIDDARYAIDFARARASARRQGGRRIAMELRKRGVPDRHIDAAIAQVFADFDEAAIVRKVIERRTRSARGPSDRRPPDGNLETLIETLTEKSSPRSIARSCARASIPA